MPSNSAVIAALVVLVAAFLGLYAVLGSPVGAALVAVGAALITALAGQQISAAAGKARLARQVRESNARVARLAGRVSDPTTRASLLRACDIVPTLLDRTERVDPASLSMTSHKLLDYLESVESVLNRYLEMQTHPGRYQSADMLLLRSRRVLTGFEDFAVQAAEQVGEANMRTFFTDLAHLELMNPPTLPPSEDL